jgi:hypothetical protein
VYGFNKTVNFNINQVVIRCLRNDFVQHRRFEGVTANG